MAKEKLLALNKGKFRVVRWEIWLPLAVILKLHGNRIKILAIDCYTLSMIQKMFTTSPNRLLLKMLFFLDGYTCLKYSLFSSHLDFLIAFYNQKYTKLLVYYISQRAKNREENKQTKKINSVTFCLESKEST